MPLDSTTHYLEYRLHFTDVNKQLSLEADDILIASGAVADKVLFKSLRGEVPELYEVGDCVEACRIYKAIY